MIEAAAAGPLFYGGDEGAAVREESRLRGRRFLGRLVGLTVAAEVEGVLDALEELMAIALGDTQEDADRLHRQLGRDVYEEVRRGRLVDPVEQRACPAAELVLEVEHRARRQPLGHEPPDPSVTRVVHHVENAARDGKILDQRAAVGAIASALRGVDLRVPQHLEHFCMRRDRPEALAVGRVCRGFVPPHWRLAAVELEQLVRKAAGKVVEIGQIDHREHLSPHGRNVA